MSTPVPDGVMSVIGAVVGVKIGVSTTLVTASATATAAPALALASVEGATGEGASDALLATGRAAMAAAAAI